MARSVWILVLAAAVVSAVLTASAFWATRPSSTPDTPAPAERPSAEIRRLRAENERLRREIAEARAAAVAAETPRPPEPPSAAPGTPAPLSPRAAPAAPGKVDLAEAAARIPACIQGLRQACAAGDRDSMDLYRRLLVGQGEPSIAPLIEILRNAGEGDLLREQALLTLQAVRAPDLASLAVEILRDVRSGPGLRNQAVALAGALPGDAGLAAIIRDLATDTAAPEAERYAALHVLVTGSPAEALPILRGLLDSGDAKDRNAALSHLQAARDRAFLPLLTEVVNGPHRPPNLQPLLNTIASIKDRPWSAVQLTGEPDTPVNEDIGTAWASKYQDMGEVWLELTYAVAVVPEGVRIRETLNPGAVAKVLARVGDGPWESLWEGNAAEGESPRWFEPPLARASGPVRTIRVVLDTNRVGGWNEIDAVELLGGGRGQWAAEARASSSYSDP
jgi:hypothetical protein